MAEAVVADAVVAAGHDGEADLVLRVRYENGGLGSLTLDAERARKLMEGCGVESAAALRGQPWRRLLHVLRQEPEPTRAKPGRARRRAPPADTAPGRK